MKLYKGRSVKVPQELATNVLLACLFMITDSVVGGEHDVAELSRGKQLGDDLLVVNELEVEARRDDPTLVEASEQFNDNFASPTVIDDFELPDVAVLLHDL